MLTNNEFNEWCKKLELSDPATELIGRIREGDPSRRVGGGRNNVVGAYPSKKMRESIQFESHKVELPGLYLKEHNDDVEEFYDQPNKIKLSYKSLKGKLTTVLHTPDIFVMYKDRAGWEEWKSEEELRKLAEKSPNRYVFIDGEWRCPPGEEYAKKFGLHYWLKSSKDIKWPLQRNMIFLEDYILDENAEVLPEVMEIVSSVVRDTPGILLLDLIKDNPGVEADDIYYMIAWGEVYVNLEEEVLAEPEFTHVYIDKETALAYKTMNSNKSNLMLKDHTIEVSSGVQVIWDGRPWTIFNVGKSKISLSAEDSLTHLPKDQFFKLVCEKQIKGVDSEIIKKIDAALTSKMREASQEELKEATFRYKIITPILEGEKIELTDVGVTSRTIRNWVRAYKEAEQLYGSGYIGLIPGINKRGNRAPHLPEDTLKAVNEFLDKNITITNKSKKVLYGKLVTYCESKGIIPPSAKTFRKMIKGSSKLTLKTKGPRAAYQEEEFYWELDMTTPRHGERPFEIAHIDHTEIDLELVQSRTRKNLGKAWITIMMDAYSRRVLAFYITFDSPSYRSDMMVIRECVRRFNRLPQTIVTDNGADFKSIYFQSLLAWLRVTHKLRPAHRSRFGSVGERLFGTAMSQLFHNLKGNTKITKNVRQVTKSVNPKNHAVWTLAALYELAKDYFYGLYDNKEHSSLGESPREAFERGIAISGKRPFRYIPYNNDFIIMTLPPIKRGTATVDPQRGVKVNYRNFYCDEFNRPNVAGTKVAVRYDPWNAGIVYCYVKGQWTMCYSDHYAIFKNRTEKEIEIYSQELLKQKKEHAKKETYSAKELADFIRKAEATEELLNQQIRDAEMVPQLEVIEGGAKQRSVTEEEVQIETEIKPGQEMYF